MANETVQAYQAAADLLRNTGCGESDVARRAELMLEFHGVQRPVMPVESEILPRTVVVPGLCAPLEWSFPDVPVAPSPSGSPTRSSEAVQHVARLIDACCLFCSHGDLLDYFFVLRIPHRPGARPLHVCASCMFGEMAKHNVGVPLSREILRVYAPVKAG